MSKKNRVKKKRVKKGPAPRKPVQPQSKLSKQRIFLYIIGILMIVSMTLGILVSGLAGAAGN